MNKLALAQVRRELRNWLLDILTLLDYDIRDTELQGIVLVKHMLSNKFDDVNFINFDEFNLGVNALHVVHEFSEEFSGIELLDRNCVCLNTQVSFSEYDLLVNIYDEFVSWLESGIELENSYLFNHLQLITEKLSQSYSVKEQVKLLYRFKRLEERVYQLTDQHYRGFELLRTTSRTIRDLYVKLGFNWRKPIDEPIMYQIRHHPVFWEANFNRKFGHLP